jgi:hypothetical protein
LLSRSMSDTRYVLACGKKYHRKLAFVMTSEAQFSPLLGWSIENWRVS